MKVKKSCNNCIRGAIIPVNSDILCRDKGVVSSDYVCKKHRFAPEIKPQKSENVKDNKCIDCENFIIEVLTSSGQSSMGLCQLFSVRQFDGNKKKACSKFARKRQLDVS